MLWYLIYFAVFLEKEYFVIETSVIFIFSFLMCTFPRCTVILSFVIAFFSFFFFCHLVLCLLFFPVTGPWSSDFRKCTWYLFKFGSFQYSVVFCPYFILFCNFLATVVLSFLVSHMKLCFLAVFFSPDYYIPWPQVVPVFWFLMCFVSSYAGPKIDYHTILIY